MPVVVIGRELARRFTGGETRIELGDGTHTVRKLVQRLDERYPGLGAVLRSNDIAVAIDGQIYQGAMLQPVNDSAEVCFLPAIEGG